MAEECEEFQIDWRGQGIIVRWCPEWLGGYTAHLEIVTADRSPHHEAQRIVENPHQLIDQKEHPCKPPQDATRQIDEEQDQRVDNGK